MFGDVKALLKINFGDIILVLQEIFKIKKSEHTDQFNLRLHRSLSWLKKLGN